MPSLFENLQISDTIFEQWAYQYELHKIDRKILKFGVIIRFEPTL